MPTLPDVQASGQRPVPQAPNGVASYEPPNWRQTGAAGQIMSSVGKDFEEASAMVAATNERQDVMAAQAATNQLSQQSMQLQTDPKTGFAQVKGGDAAKPEFATDYTQKFKDSQQQIRDALPNDLQKRLFDQHAEVTALHYRSALLQHQANETNAFNDKTENDTMDMGRRSIFQNPGDPNAFAAGVAQINWAIDQKGIRQGWSPDIVRTTKSKYMEKVYEDSVSLDVERDPFGSLDVLDKRIGDANKKPELTGNPAVDSLEPAKLIEYRRRAAAYVKSQDAQDRIAEDKRYKEAKKTIDELQTFAISGAMPSTDYENSVTAAVAGTEFEQAAKDMLRLSLIGGAFGSQSLPRQQATLRAMEASSAKGTAPEVLKLHQQADAITKTQTKAYEESAWDAWTQYGRGPQVKTEDLRQPGSAAKVVSDRVKLQDGLETVTGFATSPLKPAEAVAWATSLSGLPPDQRATELGAVGAQLTGPRIATLAEQLDKTSRPLNLALKLGADQTTAGRAVSALVLRGAQALADKSVKKDDAPVTGWRSEISGMVRGTLGDTRAEDDVIDSAYFVRAAMENEGTAVPGHHLTASNENAVNLVIGRPLEREGVKTILPRGMDARAFDEKLRANFTPEALRVQAPSGEVYVRGVPIKVEALSNRLTSYGMKRDGKGNYIPVRGNAFVTVDKEGTQPLRLGVQ